MTIWQWLGIGFGVLAVIEIAFGMVFAGIPLARDKRKRRKSREQGERGRTEPGR